MKTPIYTFALWTCALLGCAACNDMEDDDNTYATASRAVHFTAQVAAATTTRATTATATLGQGATVLIARDTNDASAFSTAYAYTADADGNLTPDGSFLTWTSSAETSMTIRACTPATATATAFTLPTDQSAGTDAADYATFQGTVARSEGLSLLDADYNNVTFTLQRRLAQVQLRVTKASEAYADCTFRVQIYSPAAGIQVAYDDATVSVTPTGNPALVTPSHASLTLGGEEAAVALLTPSASAAGVKFVEVQVYDATNEQAVSSVMYTVGIPALEAGKSYHLELDVEKDVIEVGALTVTPWIATDVMVGTQDAGKSS